MKNMQEQQKEMEDILKAELDREAREILAEIEEDESLQGLTMPEEAEEEMMQKIQKLEEERAVYEQLSEKDKEALRLGRELQMQEENTIGDDRKDSSDTDQKVITFRKKKRRVYLLVAVVAVLVMVMGMSAMGEVPLVTELKEVFFGNGDMIRVNSEREHENNVEATEESELAIYEEIKDTFQVDIIQLDYMPDNMGIVDYEMDVLLNRATIIFQCDGSIIEYQMVFNCVNKSHGYMMEDELVNETTFLVDGISIQLQEYKVEDSSEIAYAAQFDYQDVQYIFNATTTLPEAEIEKILKNIKKF